MTEQKTDFDVLRRILDDEKISLSIQGKVETQTMGWMKKKTKPPVKVDDILSVRLTVIDESGNETEIGEFGSL